MSLVVASQRNTIAGKSKAAGILNKADTEKRTPPKKIFLNIGLSVRRIRKANMVGPIIKSSALAIFPSRSGSVVKRANIVVAIT